VCCLDFAASHNFLLISKTKPMPYNPNIHHRRSIRLLGYDYAQAGLYFVTICLQHRECLFGQVLGGEMIHNDAGLMVLRWYREMENKFPDIRCHEMVVMPNHFHCIVENVGADLRVRPDENILGEQIGRADTQVGPNGLPLRADENADLINGQTHRSAPTQVCPNGSPLHRVVQWLKTMTTNEYIRGVKTLGWPPFDGKLWQRNYYEHIIRNEESHNKIADYILNNPAHWAEDMLFVEV